MFNLEDKIKWDDIAPSLQELIKKRNSKISLKDLGDDLQFLANIVNILNDNSTANGSLLKIDMKNKKIVPSVNYHSGRFVTNQNEMQAMMNIAPINLKSVFDTWERISWGSESENAKNGWRWEDGKNAINSGGNWSAYGAFISPKNYDNYYLKIKMTGWGDNDCVGIVLSAIQDDSGEWHTLTAVRAVGNDTWYGRTGFALIIDFYKQSQYNIHNDISLPVFEYDLNWNTYVTLYASRDGKSVNMKTSGRNSDDYIAEYTYSLPDVKPDDMPESTWNILVKLLSSPTKLGFCTLSQIGYFELLDQNFINPEDIYDLSTNTVYRYDQPRKTWYSYKKISDIFLPNQFFFNKKLGKLIFYKGDTDFDIVSNTGVNIDELKNITFNAGSSSIGSSGLPIGTIIPYGLDGTPGPEWLECNGQEVDATAYPELYKHITHTPDYSNAGIGAGDHYHYTGYRNTMKLPIDNNGGGTLLNRWYLDFNPIKKVDDVSKSNSKHTDVRFTKDSSIDMPYLHNNILFKYESGHHSGHGDNDTYYSYLESPGGTYSLLDGKPKKIDRDGWFDRTSKETTEAFSNNDAIKYSNCITSKPVGDISNGVKVKYFIKAK